MSDDTTIQEKIDELQSPETFDFISVLNGRGYPKDEVTVCLDEDTAHKISRLEKSKTSLIEEADMDAADAEVSALRKKLAASTYMFKLTGISSELREQLGESAKEKFKSQYETSKNFITGQVQKFEKENPERQKYLGLTIFQAHVEQIVSPDGKVVTAPEVEVIEAFLNKAPESQVMKFIASVRDLGVEAEAFEAATNEDFLVKS